VTMSFKPENSKIGINEGLLFDSIYFCAPSGSSTCLFFISKILLTTRLGSITKESSIAPFMDVSVSRTLFDTIVPIDNPYKITLLGAYSVFTYFRTERGCRIDLIKKWWIFDRIKNFLLSYYLKKRTIFILRNSRIIFLLPTVCKKCISDK